MALLLPVISLPRRPRNWRRPLAATLTAVLLAQLISASHATGIPVTDGASIADRALKHAEGMAKQIEEIALLKHQLESQGRQLASITGTRSLGDILDNPAIRAAIPPDAREILRRGEDLGGIADSVERIRREEQLSGDYEQDRKNLDRRAEQLTLRSQALMQQTQKAMTARMNQVTQLQAQINQTQDAKAIADLQARLMVEQANIQADQTRADMLTRQLEAERALMQAQADKLANSAFSVDAIRAPLPGARR